MSSTNQENSHCRYNPLLDEWIVVSPHRCNRPWKGETSKPQSFDMPDYMPGNGLCPGNTRSNGETTPNYSSTYVFDNDFPALQKLEEKESSNTSINTWNNEEQISKVNNSIFYQSKPATGKCRVMCFHPKSNVTIPLMSNNELLAIIEKWTKEVDQLQKKFCYVQVFENKGALMGCSNPHPHCQIWATNFYPNVIYKKINAFQKYFKEHKSSLILDYAKSETEIDPDTGRARGVDRIIYKCKNNNWLIVVPFWAMWPFETLLIFTGRENVGTFNQLTMTEKFDLTEAMKRICTRYDNLFQCNFPYAMGFQTEPNCSEKVQGNLGWQLHAHYFPPLLRSSTVKKHMVGFELLAQPQRDLTAEMAASKLLQVRDDEHYTVGLNKSEES